MWLEENKLPQSKEGQHLNLPLTRGPLLHQTPVQWLHQLGEASSIGGDAVYLLDHGLLHLCILECLGEREQVTHVLLHSFSHFGPRLLRRGATEFGGRGHGGGGSAREVVLEARGDVFETRDYKGIEDLPQDVVGGGSGRVLVLEAREHGRMERPAEQSQRTQ